MFCCELHMVKSQMQLGHEKKTGTKKRTLLLLQSLFYKANYIMSPNGLYHSWWTDDLSRPHFKPTWYILLQNTDMTHLQFCSIYVTMITHLRITNLASTEKKKTDLDKRQCDPTHETHAQ